MPCAFFTLLLIFFNACFLFISLLWHQKALTTFTLTLIVLPLAINLWSRYSARRLDFTFDSDSTRLFPGETLTFSAVVSNNKFLPVSIRIAFDPLERNGILNSREDSLRIGAILGFQRLTFTYHCLAHRRGCFKLEAPLITTGDLFGLYPQSLAAKRQSNRQHHPTLEIIVYPRLIPLIPFPLLQKMLFGKPGATNPVPDPIYFLGTRDYQPKRPARHIHWKASARLDRMQEKLFEPSEQETVLLVLDTDRFADQLAHGAFECTLEALASLAADLIRRNYAVGLATNATSVNRSGLSLPFSQAPDHLLLFLEQLARLELASTGPIADLLAQLQFPRYTTGVYFTYDREEPSAPQSLPQDRHSTQSPVFHRTNRVRSGWTTIICKPNPVPPSVDRNSPTSVYRLVEILAEPSV